MRQKKSFSHKTSFQTDYQYQLANKHDHISGYLI